MPEPVIRTVGLTKTYAMGGQRVHALRAVDAVVEPGEMVAIMGPSGSGKSTFMNLVGCLDRPSAGEYFLDGLPVAGMNDDRQAEVRSRKIGFVFQGFNLLPRTSAQGNVELALQYAGVRDRRPKARAALERVGLAGRMDHTPSQLSGGQQQRVAIARAIVNDPVLLLADEPTGALDTRTSEEILDLFQTLNRAGKTVVVVTHEEDVAAHCGRIVRFRDGRIVGDERVATPRSARALLAAMPPPDEDGDGQPGDPSGLAAI